MSLKLQSSAGERSGGHQLVDRVLSILGILIAALILLTGLVMLLKRGPDLEEPMPDFAAIDDISERKAAFFAFLDPFIHEANGEILEAREHIESLSRRVERGKLGKRDRLWLQSQGEQYGLSLAEDESPDLAWMEALLLRADVIPPSLALAQAALESGWGTSRFAQQGNNLYGIWCYEPGCGLVPRRRPEGATYEVTRYRSPKECFDDYIRNLNANRAYESLWRLRASARAEGRPLTGVDLAGGLMRYSQEGQLYIDKVRRVIRGNELTRYDTY
jgi:Bax protein